MELAVLGHGLYIMGCLYCSDMSSASLYIGEEI